MYIQKHILPKWNNELKKSELENVNIDHWMKTGRSMAEYLDRFLMKEVPENWFNGWMRYKYPLKVSNEIFNGKFGKADSVLIEEFLEGEEMSYFVICDGKDYKFQATKWLEMLKKKEFREAVLEIMDEAVVKGIKLEE